MILLSCQEFPGPLHVLPQHSHLFLDLLNPHLGFDLEFLEELGLGQIGLLSDQLLDQLFQLLFPAPVLQLLEPVAVALLCCVGLPLLRGIRPGLQVRFQRRFLRPQEHFELPTVRDPPTPERLDPIIPAGRRLDRVELATEDALLEIVIHPFELIPDDAEDPAHHLVVERLPQFVDRREGVVEDQQGVEPGAVKGSD